MKKNKSGKSTFIAIASVFVVAVLILVGVTLSRNLLGGNAAMLPVSEFGKEPKAYAGNVYEFEGRIDTLLGFEEGVGRMILTRDLSTDKNVPLFVDAKLEGFSPNPGQIYRFQLSVDGQGVLVVDSFKKL